MMKKLIFLMILEIAALQLIYAQNVSISNTGSSPDESAMLDVQSTDKGFLMPRMTTAQRTAISNPATGLLVYDSETNSYWYNIGTPASPNWTELKAPNNDGPIPTDQYPTFTSSSFTQGGISPNYLDYPVVRWQLEYALWVGYDVSEERWKYLKDTELLGLVDPGDPQTWVVNGTTIGYFDGNLSVLPSATHRNNRYIPGMAAMRFNQDDIVIKVGDFWIDKYCNRIIDTKGTESNADDQYINPVSGYNTFGNGQGISPNFCGFSQMSPPSVNLTFFTAQRLAANAGKRIPTNEEWQSAALGTLQSEGNDVAGGRANNWDHDGAIEISYYGVCGMAGNVWQWVASWGQYGRDLQTDENFSPGEEAMYEPNGTPYYYYARDFSMNVCGSAYSATISNFFNNRVACLVRGGSWNLDGRAGIYSIAGTIAPSHWGVYTGFRCVSQ